MYNTILCAIEASQEGRYVLSKAVELSKKFDSKLIVLNVLPYSFLPKDYQKELKESAIPKFEEITEDFGVSKRNRALKVGKPYEVICKEAEKRNVDLIVLGTHSKKGLSSLIGSTANSIVNYAHCDVTLVRI
ncbi:universal stress protein [Microbulbifer sp. JMSA004]|uniref:universal stress protein n=1 Tax=unclassified Microbulbifer TaxID=2619833 RepID=UPI0024AD0DDA|nr:universal stress protein [Microbulbifer sp. VAAF005]WHI46632.1 universal stress protein [Microbulbifer sp. VAAF005]